MTHLTLHIDSFAHGGVGVARDNGRVVFVADAIPGETVVAELTEEKKSFARAVATEVLEASPDRVAHIWPEASIDRAPAQRAGGADLGFVSLKRQRLLKTDVITDALSRFGGGATEFTLHAVEPTTAWRSRVSLHVNERGVAGPRAARSHEVIEVASYPLAAAAIAAQAPWRERYPGAARVDLVASSTGEIRTSVLQSDERPDQKRVVHERVNGREFTVAESGFWQVHVAAAETLQRAVSNAIRPDLFDPTVEHLDLYGGVGLLAVPLLEAAGTTAKLVTVEASERATELAQENLADWIGSSAVTSRVDRFLQCEQIAAGSTVVIDPPRAGAGREVVDRLAASQAAQVIYVACDPVAFARDLGYFRAAGWNVDSLEAFDLFPHTHHVELVARIVPQS
ncbi:MAG: class I SAM-dependent RNA methyltransferase [Microbacteriaceae bacterium]